LNEIAAMSNQYQLTNVEAQRIMAVLDELTSDLRFAFRLTPQHLASMPDIAPVVVHAKLRLIFFISGNIPPSTVTLGLSQGQENERFFAMQAELEKQFSVLAAQLEGPVSEFEDSERESQVAFS
jgi:hypothetical protein